MATSAELKAIEAAIKKVNTRLDRIEKLLLDVRPGYDQPLNRLAVIEADTKIIRKQLGVG